ncbi:hypothetical protein KKF38_01570 [Patescibacteria group bacterium]|nr:hypothetical protein [Patescibacteria group bacterium]
MLFFSKRETDARCLLEFSFISSRTRVLILAALVFVAGHEKDSATAAEAFAKIHSRQRVCDCIPKPPWSHPIDRLIRLAICEKLAEMPPNSKDQKNQSLESRLGLCASSEILKNLLTATLAAPLIEKIRLNGKIDFLVAQLFEIFDQAPPERQKPNSFLPETARELQELIQNDGKLRAKFGYLNLLENTENVGDDLEINYQNCITLLAKLSDEEREGLVNQLLRKIQPTAAN